MSKEIANDHNIAGTEMDTAPAIQAGLPRGPVVAIVAKEQLSRGAKLASSFLLASIGAISIGLALAPKASDYEISPLVRIDSVTIILLAGAPAVGFFLTLLFGTILRGAGRHDWKVVWVLTVGLNALVVSLPAGRGYTLFGRDDLLTHVGYVNDIANSGELPGNIYPFMHLLLWMAQRTSTLPIQPLFMLLPATAVLLGSAVIFAGARTLTKITRVQASIAAYSLLVLKEPWIIPQTVALYLLFMLVVIEVSGVGRNKMAWMLVLLLVVTGLPFFHPVVTFIGIAGLLTLQIAAFGGWVQSRRKAAKDDVVPNAGRRASKPSYVFLIMTAVFLLWTWDNFYFWQNNVQRMAAWLAGEPIAPSRTQELIGILGAYGIDSVGIVAKVYATLMLVVAAEFVQGIMQFRNKNQRTELWQKRLAVWLLPSTLLTVVTLATPAIFIEPTRPIAFVAIVSLPLLGVTWPRLKSLRVHVNPRIFALSVAAIYSIAGVAGFFGTYDPIYTKIPNQQVTAAELGGTDWLLTHDAPPGLIKEVISRHFRLAQASLGSVRSFEIGVVQNYRTPGLTVAPHFGYDRSDSIQNVTVAGTYVIVSEYDRSFYLSLFPQVDKFNANDFLRLETDYGADLIYDSGGYSVYYTNAVSI